MEEQFSDTEKRFVLAEAIKKSSISIDKLFLVVNENNITPDWEHMLLPIGRDLSQCKNAFETLRRDFHGLPSQLPTPQPVPQLPPSFLNPTFPSTSNKRQSVNIMPGPDTKRRKSANETATPARDILPKPSNGSPMSMTSISPAGPSNQKKRGRPSKADVERKQREAIERGDIIPPAPLVASSAGPQGQEEVRTGSFTPVMIAPAPALAPAPSPQRVMTPAHVLSPQMGMEQGPPVTMSGSSSAKKRKPRPPPKPKVQKPGESQFSIYPPVDQPEEEKPFTSASTESVQAGPIAAPVEAVNLPSSSTSVINQDPAPEPQPKPDVK